MSNIDKLILTDCDGVLLDWHSAFKKWMHQLGYELNKVGEDCTSYYIHDHYHDLSQAEAFELVTQFSLSDAIGELEPFRDSLEYVKRMHEEHGYRFRVITSFSDNENAIRLRQQNLEKYFGDAIEMLISLPIHARKNITLLNYNNSNMYWIEDKERNADDGLAAGLRPILVEHEFNKHHECSYPIVKTWEEIYNIIVK